MDTKGFLSSQEEWLFKEVELLHRLHTEIRDTHLKYQSWFMLVHGVLIAAVINLRIDENFTKYYFIYYLIVIFGIILGICCVLLQLRHILDGRYRMRRIRDISQMIRKPVVTDKTEIGEFMSFIGGDIKTTYKFKSFKYSRIRLFVDSLFPILWLIILMSSIINKV